MEPLNSLYFGVIEEIYAPNHALNQSKYQYQYRVLITIDNYAQLPVQCVRMDAHGSLHNYTDTVMSAGSKVLVMFPRGDRSIGVIVGGTRSAPFKQDSNAQYFQENRFNEMVETFDFKGSWMMRSINGPFAKIEKTKVTISDTPIKQSGDQINSYKETNDKAKDATNEPFDGQFIILDKTKKELLINTNQYKLIVNENADVHVRKNSKVQIDGAAQITINKDADITVKGNTNLKVNKDVTADIKGELKAKVGKDVSVTSAGKAKVKAKNIELQSDGASFPLSDILTTQSDPFVDMILGLPTLGLSTIKAGK
jgi:hypothetical protein